MFGGGGGGWGDVCVLFTSLGNLTIWTRCRAPGGTLAQEDVASLELATVLSHEVPFRDS